MAISSHNTPPVEDGSMVVASEHPNEQPAERNAPNFLQLTHSAYESSSDYMSSNLRRQWERNIANFNSSHPNGSKYYTSAYLNRSQVFRPKSRSSVRQNEAAAVAAFFSTMDIVSILPENYNDQKAQIAADIMSELVNLRLTKTIDWFQICIGAFQDAMVYGTCVSRVEWLYNEVVVDGPGLLAGAAGADGSLLYEEEIKILDDRPEIELIANENFRIDPGADWNDPVNTSPYVIEIIPMYIKDVKARMEGDDPKTKKQNWFYMTDSQMMAAVSDQYGDSTRLEREGRRQDPTDNYQDIDDFTIVWIYRVIMDVGGQDMTWYTLGSQAMLTDPVPLEDVCLSGRRPYVMGKCVIEANTTSSLL